MVMALSREEEAKPHWTPHTPPTTITELAPKKDMENPKSVSTTWVVVSWKRRLSQCWREGFQGVSADSV